MHLEHMMDLEAFQQMLDAPNRSQQEFLCILSNARRKNALPQVLLVERALRERYPEQGRTASGRGGSRRTTAMFHSEPHLFPSQKEAYIWLIERFVAFNPKPFVELDWETVYVVKGPRILYFAKSLKALFRQNPHLAERHNRHHRLTNGWYVQLVLNEDQKVEILVRLAALSHQRMGVDWDWNSCGLAPDRLDAEQLLQELASPTTEAPRRVP
jgi:hypothetical protein